MIIFEATLGSEHPDTQSSQQWLSIIEAAIEKRTGKWWQRLLARFLG